VQVLLSSCVPSVRWRVTLVRTAGRKSYAPVRGDGSSNDKYSSQTVHKKFWNNSSEWPVLDSYVCHGSEKVAMHIRSLYLQVAENERLTSMSWFVAADGQTAGSD
jgi:hypothetical protein